MLLDCDEELPPDDVWSSDLLLLDCDALLCAGFELVELLFVFGFTVVGWIASVAAVLDGSTEVDCSVEATVSTTETES